MTLYRCPMCDAEGTVVVQWTTVHESGPVELFGKWKLFRENQLVPELVLNNGELFAADNFTADPQDDYKLHCSACEYTWKPEGGVTLL